LPDGKPDCLIDPRDRGIDQLREVKNCRSNQRPVSGAGQRPAIGGSQRLVLE
jgi:hypothetical protein